MAANKLYNIARMSVATTGTGAALSLGSAVTRYISFAQAGALDGDVISYGIQDGVNSEVGTLTYHSAGPSVTRTTIASTNGNAALNLTPAAEIYITPLAADILAALQATKNLSDVNDPVTAGFNLGVRSKAVADRTAIAALDPTKFNAAFIYNEGGRNGYFVLVSGTAPTDASQGVYIASGTAGYYWKRVYDGGVSADWFGAKGDGATDDKAAIQAAMDFVAAQGGGTVKFGAKTYKVNGTLTIASRGVQIEGTTGVQLAGTTFSWTPSASATALFSVNSGAAITSGIAFRHFYISSPDTTTYKIGIDVWDGSYIIIDHVYITLNGGFSASITGAASSGASNEILLTVANASVNFADGRLCSVSGVVGTTEANECWEIQVVDATHIKLRGSTFTNAYVSGGTLQYSSTCVRLHGRELFSCRDVGFAGDVGLHITSNPNNSVNALDESNFHNCTFVATGTNACVLIAGVTMTSVSFTGYQSWGGGKSAFKWADKASAAISEQIYIGNVRAEQKSVAGGWFFDIQTNTALYSLTIENPLLSDRQGIRLRNVLNATLIAPHSVNGTDVALDINSTVSGVSCIGGYWIAGSISAVSGQTLLCSTESYTANGRLPSSFEFSATSLSKGVWTAYTPTVSTSTGTLTTKSATGAYKQIGKTVHYRINITVTTLGTGAGRLIATLPVTNISAGIMSLGGGFNETTLKAVHAAEYDGAGLASIFYYDGTFPVGASGQVVHISGTYEAA